MLKCTYVTYIPCSHHFDLQFSQQTLSFLFFACILPFDRNTVTYPLRDLTHRYVHVRVRAHTHTHTCQLPEKSSLEFQLGSYYPLSLQLLHCLTVSSQLVKGLRSSFFIIVRKKSSICLCW